MREQALWKWELGGKAAESVPGRENSKCKDNKLKHVWGGQEKAVSHRITASKVGQNWEPSDFHKLTTQMVFSNRENTKGDPHIVASNQESPWLLFPSRSLYGSMGVQRHYTFHACPQGVHSLGAKPP